MRQPLPLLLLVVTCCGCAVHRAQADAHRAWVDVTLDDPMELERVLAFLETYDPMMVGERAVVPATVDEARGWLDDYRRESRHWIDEVIEANERFDPSHLPQATIDELSQQLVAVVLELGPIHGDDPLWPEGANPYPWHSSDAELRASLFGLYLQTGRLCPHASGAIPGCLVTGEAGTVNLPWELARQLTVIDVALMDGVQRAPERAMLEGQRSD
jgi:hypothetical protein